MTGVLNARDEKRAAAAEKKKKRQSEADNTWKGFVQLELNEYDKTQAKLLRDDGERLADNVFGLVDDLYKVSLSYDTYNDMYVCSATGKDPKSPNNGLTLTGRGGSLLGAMAAFWYKHDVLLDHDWTTAEARGRKSGGEDDIG